MKPIIAILAILMLAACGKSESPQPQKMPTAEELAADPARLKELREQCKTDRSRLGDVLCNRVAEATNRRFFGDGKVPYTPPASSLKF